jgi:DNA-binding beta-propeller fold protein YncE
VFVTGSSNRTVGSEYTTVAYRAGTGTQLWARRYRGTSSSFQNLARSVAVSPTGTRVYVTGYSYGSSPHAYATIAYNAATGAQAWAKRYANSSSLSSSGAWSVAVSPINGTVFVTGQGKVSAGGLTGGAYVTIAYHG